MTLLAIFIYILFSLLVFAFAIATGAMLFAARRLQPDRITGHIPDTLILLGCKIRTRSIENRIRTAADWMKDHPHTICICSGGQGKDEDISEADHTVIALAHPRLDRKIRRGVEADQLHRHRAAARMRGGEEELRRCLCDPREPPQLIKVVLLHIEMCGHPLNEYTIETARRIRFTRQDNNIRTKPLLKTPETVLETEQDERAAKEDERENCRHRTERGRTRRAVPAVADSEKMRKRHASAPFRYT